MTDDNEMVEKECGCWELHVDGVLVMGDYCQMHYLEQLREVEQSRRCD